MRTIGTLFSGFEGVGVGAQAAGFTHAWGVEYDAAIASVAQVNGFTSRVMDVCDANPNEFDRVDWLHASPPCIRASVANQSAEINDEGTKETLLDVAMARAVARFIRTLKPQFVTIENVTGYRRFKKCMRVLNSALDESGYWSVAEVLNAADFGVPQSRRRWILRAQFGDMPAPLPPPVAWVGWYEAIKDLIPSLPDSRFAEWQLKRLPDELRESLLVNTNQSGDDGSNICTSDTNNPTFTVTQSAEGRLRAFIMPTVNADGTAHERMADEPTHTTQATAYKNMPRAFILDGQPAFASDDNTIRDDCEPVFTVGASQGHRPLRAFLVRGDNTQQEWGKGYKTDDEPTMTIGISTASKAYASGRVVQMTPRALARFQSFPDWYQLPANAAMAVKGIGNAVPPLLMQRIGESFT